MNPQEFENTYINVVSDPSVVVTGGAFGALQPFAKRCGKCVSNSTIGICRERTPNSAESVQQILCSFGIQFNTVTPFILTN